MLVAVDKIVSISHFKDRSDCLIKTLSGDIECSETVEHIAELLGCPIKIEKPAKVLAELPGWVKLLHSDGDLLAFAKACSFIDSHGEECSSNCAEPTYDNVRTHDQGGFFSNKITCSACGTYDILPGNSGYSQ